jgi:hypothetical protein
MNIRLIRRTALVASLLLSACSSIPPHEYLPAPAQQRIATTDVVVPIRQSEIYVYVPPSTAGAAGGAAFGLVGAIVGAVVDASVNAARSSKAEAAVKPLRDSLVDYNFDNAMQGDLKSSLGQVAFLNVAEVHEVKDVTNDALDASLAGSKQGAVLFVTTDYHLSNDGDVLYITVAASLFGNNDALRSVKAPPAKSPKTSLKNALYYNTMVFETKVAGASSDRDHNIANWSADHGAAMRAALDVGARELAAMLASDIQRSEKDSAGPPGAMTAKLENQTGTVVGSDDNGSILRFKDGTLKFAAKSVL